MSESEHNVPNRMGSTHWVPTSCLSRFSRVLLFVSVRESS